MTIFYICRHGETVNNLNHVLSGWADTPLTETGVQQAEAAARKLAELQFDAVITSDLERAVSTATIIAHSIGYEGDIIRRYELREVNYGDFTNQPYTVYPTMTPLENAEYVTPNGESLAIMQKRVMGCIHELALAHPDQTVLIVAHDGTINAVRATYNRESIGIADTIRNPHDAVYTFTYEGTQLVSFAELNG